MNTIEIKGQVLGRRNSVKVRRATSVFRKLYKFQDEIIESHLTKNRYTLTESPMGSGKSTVMITFGARKIKEGRKVLIATPKLLINSGFTKYTRKNRFVAGDFVLPVGSIKEAKDGGSGKSGDIIDWLEGPERTILVCSYQSLIRALKSRKRSVREALANTVLLIDEVHHSVFGETEYDGKMLGGIVSGGLKKCTEVHAFTATAFRTDRRQIISDEFVQYKRTLKEHYNEGFCPDFGLFINFYKNVKKEQFDRINDSITAMDKFTRSTDNTVALIESYLNEFEDNQLPTLMAVDTAKQAKMLQDALFDRFEGFTVVNLASEDGVTYESTKPRIQDKFNRLDSEEEIDVVIACKVMDEGGDWPDCAQTFSPRVSSSLQLLYQRAIGRAMRRKRKGHISPSYSRVVLFEIGIDESDNGLVAGALFNLAVRLKAVCEGLSFNTAFKLPTTPKTRKKLDSKKQSIQALGISIINDIQQKIITSASKELSVYELIKACIKQYGECGVVISNIAALEILISTGAIKTDKNRLSKWAATRLNARLVDMDLDELLNTSKELRRILDNTISVGVSDYIQMLGHDGSLKQISTILREHLTSPTDKIKQTILQMIKDGKPKPHYSSRLRNKFNSYISPNSNCYDQEFAEEVRRLAPHWLQTMGAVSKNKQTILQMIKDGKPKPHHKTKIGNRLKAYTSPNSNCYDQEFTEEVMRLVPLWLQSPTDKIKQTILQMIKDGKPKPHHKTRLRDRLNAYTSPNHKCYDQEFTEEVKRLAPHWFRNTANKNKQTILQMIKDGKSKPKRKTKIGDRFYAYISPNSNCYDQEFAEEVKRLAPHWLQSPTNKNKQTILQMIKDGKPKPHYSSRLRKKFNSYTLPKSKYYDQEFAEEVKRLAPHWLQTMGAVSKNKQTILQMIKDGKPKPHHKTKIRDRLKAYTSPNSSCYDQEFTEEVKRLAPHWLPVPRNQKSCTILA